MIPTNVRVSLRTRNDFPRVGWSHRPMAIRRVTRRRDAAAIVLSLLAIGLMATRQYDAVAGLVVGVLVVVIVGILATRPTPDHVDAWRRNHRSRAGDRW